MANNYVLFAGVIGDLTDDERAWLKGVLDADEDVASEELDEEVNFWPDFDYEFQESDLLVYSDDCGNLDSVATMVRAFLNKFRPDDVWEMEWAETCNQHRPGNFGGGAMVVNACGIEWMSTLAWLGDKRKERDGDE